MVDLAGAGAKLFAPEANSSQFWTSINWIFVSLYWTCLFDLGQVASTINPSTDDLNIFANSSMLPPTNSIFSNPVLFQHYFANLIFTEYTGISDPNVILPLDQNNVLQPANVTFVRTYSCTQLVQKATISIVQAVLIGVWAFAHSTYALLSFILGHCCKKRGQDSVAFLFNG
jgi:hypothetical protein